MQGSKASSGGQTYGWVAGALLAALVAFAGAPSMALAAPEPHRADGSPREWRGSPSFIAGRTVLSRGELIHTDYLQDDYGPDLSGAPRRPAFSNSVPTDGDYRYPREERYADNAADLREVRLAADRRRVHVLVRMQTMVDPTAATVLLAFDSDGERDTGAASWPAGAGIEATPGADRFLVLSADRGRLFVADAAGGTAVREVPGLQVAVNARTNAIEASIPRGALRLRPGARMHAIGGLATPDGDLAEQEGGGTAAFDAAFQGKEEFGGLRGWWSDRKQSRLLADEDLVQLSERLPIRAMRRGRSRPKPPLEAGYHNAVYRSRIAFGEGVERRQERDGPPVGGESSFTMVAEPIFRSRHQPYGLYIPDGYRPDRSQMTLVGHSLGLSHNQYGVLTPNLLRQLGDERNSVLVTPSARGTDTAYLEAGFEDAVEALEHAQSRLRTDPRRVSITGYSMGGYMTYRLGLLMPDRFARASVYAGPPAYAFWAPPAEPIAEEPEWIKPGQTNKIVENAVNLPYEVVHGTFDELVPITGVLAQVERFRRLRLQHRFFHHQADDHNTFIANDEWGRTREWLGEHRIPACPRYVTYKRYPIMDLPRLERRFDGAYWVNRIVRRGGDTPADAGPEDFALVAAESRPRPGRETAVEEIDEPVPGPTTPGRLTGLRPVREGPLPRRNTLRLSLTDVAGLRIATGCAGIDRERKVRVALHGDGPVRLALAGRWPARVSARLGGERIGVRRRPRAVVLEVEPRPDGSTIVIEPR